MLTILRSKASGIVARIFIGLLVVSFAIWGISDIFRGRVDDALVTVGETTITVEQYQQTFRNELNRLSNRLGKPVTPDEARQLGLDQRVLGLLVRNAVLDEETRRLKLDLSPEFVAERVAELDIFKGPDGRFDVARFRRMLASAGMSEGQFIEEEKRGVLRNALLRPVQEGLVPPRTLVEIVYEHTNAARDVQFFRVPADGIEVPEPDEKALKAFYEKNGSLFAIPERRQLALLPVLPEKMAAAVKVDDAEIAAYYERHKDGFGRPEMRTVEQIAFASEKEAAEARKRLTAGEIDWAALAAEKGLKEKDVRLGTFSRKTFPDPKIADAVFALAQGEVSRPLKGTLSISLVRVTKIEPGRARTLAEARAEIEKRLKLEKAKDLAYELHDRIEDRRASGQSLDDIARELGIKMVVTPHISAGGIDEKGARVSLPGGEALLKAAFESDVGVDNDPVPTADDGFVWFDVRDVKPAGTRPFTKVREKVVKLWKKQRRRELARRHAEELRKRAAAGEDLAALAASLGATVRTITGLKRNDARADFPAAAVRAVFAGPERGVIVAPAADGVSWLVVKSTPLATPPMDANADQVRSIRQVLAQSLAEDMQAQFLAALQKEFGMHINQARWAQITGQPLQ